jgi:hypothetical protein
MPDSAYAAFIEDCRQERAHLIGLIEALEGKRINPGAPIAVPDTMQAATAATLLSLQAAVAQLNTLLEAYGKSGS